MSEVDDKKDEILFHLAKFAAHDFARFHHASIGQLLLLT